MKPGDQMTWTYTPRGGYGWVIPVNAEVLKVNSKTVRIRVKRIDGCGSFDDDDYPDQDEWEPPY